MLLAQTQPIQVHIHDTSYAAMYTTQLPGWAVLVMLGGVAVVVLIVLGVVWFALRCSHKTPPPLPPAGRGGGEGTQRPK